MPRWKPHHARRKRRDSQQKLGYWVRNGPFPTEWISGPTTYVVHESASPDTLAFLCYP